MILGVASDSMRLVLHESDLRNLCCTSAHTEVDYVNRYFETCIFDFSMVIGVDYFSVHPAKCKLLW